ncbi:hypothetical protein Ancab_034947 [Ancistrocladus abbreviatus]
MGYLSCKAESAIAVSNPQSPSPHKPTSIKAVQLRKPQEQHQQPHEKPIKIQQFDYSDLEAATNNFSDQKLLGRGSHGLVYKAVLRSGRLVAVKKPSRRSSPANSAVSDSVNEFDNELHILSSLQSPRFVNLLGYTADDSNDKLLVVEFMSNGTLYDVLHSNSKPPNWGRRVKLALQIAKAIETLHSQYPPVIHRDIKSANVLIDRNNNARLGDFGLALRCHLDDYRLRSTPPAGTIGYLDPSYVTPDNLSTKADVFSFGILLLEIISGRKAIDVGHSPPSIVDWAIPLVRKGKLLAIFDPRIAPPKDPMVRKQLGVIAAKCVRSCRERRPMMEKVVEALTGLSKLVPLHSWNGLTNPCMMVEAVGQPVASGNTHSSSRFRGLECSDLDDVDGKLSSLSRNSRRVYSDLGFGSNLMDLLAEPDGDFDVLEQNRVEHKSKSMSRGLSFRSMNGRYTERGSN